MVRYTGALLMALADYEISDAEVDHVGRLRAELGLAHEQVQAAHATFFGGVIMEVAKDGWVDADECRHLARVRSCLQALGWAPGD